jgi:hypothetical protein
MKNARGNIIFGLILLAVLKTPAAAISTPLGLKGLRHPAGTTITILWNSVSGAAGYNVYRRDSISGTPSKINAYLLPVPIYADRIDGGVFFYSVRAVDTSGHESADSCLVDSSVKANLIFLSNDGQTRLLIPGSMADLLRADYNKYDVPLTVRFLDQYNAGDHQLVRQVSFQLVRGDTGEETAGVSLPLPEAEIQMGYQLLGGQVAVNGLSALNAGPEQLCLFWFNGVDWVKVGGTNDPQSQTITIKSSQLGQYQLRVAPKATSLSLGKANVFPGLFTPNGDGFNDRVYFVLQNPNNASVTGEIFDAAGRSIVTLAAPSVTPGLGTTLIWSGKDATGAVVPSGLYMYRIEGDGQTISGTVSVAR